MKKAQFKGYILEEVIAHLIRTSGYSLITHPSANDPDICISHNGLNVRGRGAQHQVDVLGEMNWIPSFHFPSRLIIEAKFRSETTGIDVIRGEVGILNDINENYFVVEGGAPRPRYRYSSVIVSTSGFTKPSVGMAIAHQIQLVDFSDDKYETLRNEIEALAYSLVRDRGDIDSGLVARIKSMLRENLNGRDNNNDEFEVSVQTNLTSLIQAVHSYRELFVGMSQGGFMLLLKADDPDRFISFAKQNPNHDVAIHWTSEDGGMIWTIKPVYSNDYTLSFKLPAELHDWIFKIAKDKFEEALYQKELNFSKISIYYKDPLNDRDYIFNLRFSRDNLREDIGVVT